MPYRFLRGARYSRIGADLSASESHGTPVPEPAVTVWAWSRPLPRRRNLPRLSNHSLQRVRRRGGVSQNHPASTTGGRGSSHARCGMPDP